MHLRLEYNTPGGMEKYISEFERLLDMLNNAEQPLDEDKKHTIFLEGIVDRDYDAVKDICMKYDYEETVLTLRNKSVELGKSTNPRNNRRNANQQQNPGGSNDCEAGNDENNNNNSTYDSGRLPPEVWNRMSPANRKFWIDSRRKARNANNNEPESYGLQYGGQGQASARQANHTSTTTNENSPSEQAAQDDRQSDNESQSNQAGRIWRPSSHLHNTNTNRNNRNSRSPGW